MLDYPQLVFDAAGVPAAFFLALPLTVAAGFGKAGARQGVVG